MLHVHRADDRDEGVLFSSRFWRSEKRIRLFSRQPCISTIDAMNSASRRRGMADGDGDTAVVDGKELASAMESEMAASPCRISGIKWNARMSLPLRGTAPLIARTAAGCTNGASLIQRSESR